MKRVECPACGEGYLTSPQSNMAVFTCGHFDVPVAGRRPEQTIRQLRDDDRINVIMPGGAVVKYRVQSVHADYQRGVQITLEVIPQ